MHTQADTAMTTMTTMLATTTTATDDSAWLPPTLFFGHCLVWVGLTFWVYSVTSSDNRRTHITIDGSRRTQMIIGSVTIVIGLLISMIGLLIWSIP